MGGEIRRRVSEASGNSPQWNNNGKELFYISDESNLVAIPFSSGERKFRTGVPRTVALLKDIVEPDRLRFRLLIGTQSTPVEDGFWSRPIPADECAANQYRSKLAGAHAAMTPPLKCFSDPVDSGLCVDTPYSRTLKSLVPESPFGRSTPSRKLWMRRSGK